MEGVALGAVLGLGLLLVFDAITRPNEGTDLGYFLRRIGPRTAGGAAGGVIAQVMTGWPVAVAVGAALGWLLPAALIRSRSERERIRKIEALGEVAARLRDAIRSGIGLQDALAQAARHAPPILAADLQRLVVDLRVSGAQVAGASFAERVPDPAAELLGSVLSLAERLGARSTSEVLDSLAEATAARAAALREARTRQTRQRVSARVVASFPLLLVLAIRQANPDYLAPFDRPAGQLVLALALGLIAAGYGLMLRAGRIEGAGT